MVKNSQCRKCGVLFLGRFELWQLDRHRHSIRLGISPYKVWRIRHSRIFLDSSDEGGRHLGMGANMFYHTYCGSVPVLS